MLVVAYWVISQILSQRLRWLTPASSKLIWGCSLEKEGHRQLLQSQPSQLQMDARDTINMDLKAASQLVDESWHARRCCLNSSA
jgi:hypothetical protein